MDPHSMSNHTLVDSVRSAAQQSHEVHESWIKNKTIEPKVNPYTFSESKFEVDPLVYPYAPLTKIEVGTPVYRQNS